MIESIHNPKVKRWVELLTKKGREKYSAYLIEGARLVKEAIQSGSDLEAVLWQSGKSFPFLSNIGIEKPLWEVSEAVMNKLTDTQHSQGIAAVVRIKKEKPDFASPAFRFLLLVDGVQDPGNLGTVIRSADAAGVDGVILGEGTVDLYNPKTVRSTMGSIFHLPIISASLKETIPILKNSGTTVIASSLDTDLYYDEADYPDRVAIVVGNEGKGISEEILKLCDLKVKIPIYGKAESLNVGMATSLLLYEVRRRNRKS